ncbi:MAG: glycine dehydrogenase, partial [Burkholderiales bacterium]|nr:glycine dehydrogenase [Anaerolineae bacterium]
NICTNQGLMALAACVYLALMGKQGLRKVAELCYHKAHYAAKQISALKGFSVDQSLPYFHEFVVKCPMPAARINERLIEQGIIGGYDLVQDYAHFKNHMLVCVTEMNTKDEIDMFVEALGEVAKQ